MKLADAAAAGPPPRSPGPPCSMGMFEDRLDDADREALAAMMEDDRWMSSAIHDVLAEGGYNPPKQYTVNRHRNGRCNCG